MKNNFPVHMADKLITEILNNIKIVIITNAFIRDPALFGKCSFVHTTTTSFRHVNASVSSKKTKNEYWKTVVRLLFFFLLYRNTTDFTVRYPSSSKIY